MTDTTIDTHADFHRLATGLRAVEIDFDYYRTRKVLDPNWDGYMPKGHDIIRDNIAVTDANLLTSQHRGNPDLHRIVLDLDYGVTRQPGFTGRERLILSRNMDYQIQRSFKYLAAALTPKLRPHLGRGVVDITPECDFALIPSTTPGHHHLILDVDLRWDKYGRLLRLLADAGIIERGYANASIRKQFSAIRPPWIKKPKTEDRQHNPTPVRLIGKQ